MLPWINLKNRGYTKDPLDVTNACDEMLDKLKQKDIRWEILQNDHGRANNRLYRSLFNYMTKKIGGEEEDKTVSDHGAESASSKESVKTISMLGKRNQPEQLSITPKNSPKGP